MRRQPPFSHVAVTLRVGGFHRLQKAQARGAAHWQRQTQVNVEAARQPRKDHLPGFGARALHERPQLGRRELRHYLSSIGAQVARLQS